ncbi:hypothetical protein CN09_11485 [Rhizobium rhizogenes]|nr:hypothetical protein CN09_11485 [Rhizobium rhizogenes]
MIAFCNPVAGRKHRVYIADNGQYGLEAKIERGLWAHVVNDNQPLLFTDKRLATVRAKELSRAA